MGKYDDVSLAGGARERAVARCRELFAAWGLTPPPVEPLALDFGLGEFDRTGLIEYWLANEAACGYCGKFLVLFDAQRCPCHSHRMKHETFYVVKGQLEMIVDDVPRRMSEGDLLVMPPGRRHTFAAYGGGALILEVSMPSIRQDNFFDDHRIGESGVI